jgi:hypothetical protein
MGAFQQILWLSLSGGQNRNAEGVSSWGRQVGGYSQGVNGKRGVWQGGFMNMNHAMSNLPPLTGR